MLGLMLAAPTAAPWTKQELKFLQKENFKLEQTLKIWTDLYYLDESLPNSKVITLGQKVYDANSVPINPLWAHRKWIKSCRDIRRLNESYQPHVRQDEIPLECKIKNEIKMAATNVCPFTDGYCLASVNVNDHVINLFTNIQEEKQYNADRIWQMCCFLVKVSLLKQTYQESFLVQSE